MTTDEIIAKAMLNSHQREEALQAITLIEVVRRQITCIDCGKVLDIRDSVVIDAVNPCPYALCSSCYVPSKHLDETTIASSDLVEFVGIPAKKTSSKIHFIPMTIPDKTGKPMAILGYHVSGEWIIRKMIYHGCPAFYRVTHTPSGGAISVDTSLSESVKFAKYLAKTIPEGLDTIKLRELVNSDSKAMEMAKAAHARYSAKC